MAGTKKGVSAFWFLEDLTLSVAAGSTSINAFLSATGTFNFQSFSVTRKAAKAELKDNNANVVGEGFANDMYEGNFDGIPSGVTLTAAKTMNILPRAGDNIIIVDANEPHLTPEWIVDEATCKGDLNSPRSISIKCHRYADSNVSKTMSIT